MIVRRGDSLGEAMKRYLLAFIAAVLAVAPAVAQEYPTRPIRLIVPFPTGGGVDILGRIFAQKLSEQWGQGIVVDNRPGATGSIGSEIAARATPDGYTLLIGNVATHAVNVSLFKRLSYHPIRDFQPITLVALVPQMLLVNPAFQASNVKQLIALAKARPGRLIFGSAGSGSPPHFAAAQFMILAKIEMTHVPYKGTVGALTDLMSGQINLYFSNILTAVPLAKSGKLKALGVTGSKRARAAPDVPTIAEAGVPGYEEYNWFGILAPRKVPKAVVDKWHSGIVAALRERELETRLTNDGAEIVGSSPEEFGRFIRQQVGKYARIVKEAGLRID